MSLSLSAPDQLDERRDQRTVGGRHGTGSEVARPHPFQSLRFARLCEALPAAADKERHQQVEIGIGMAGECQRREARLFDGYADFLVQLADQRRLGPLAGLDFAAREFP